MAKLRIHSWIVKPILLADDGENLVAVNVPEQTILAVDWETFKAGGDDECLRPLREELEPMNLGEVRAAQRGRVPDAPTEPGPTE